MHEPVFRAVLRSRDCRPRNTVTLDFPLEMDEYDTAIRLLKERKMGAIVQRDCCVIGMATRVPYLQILNGRMVNVDELDHLAMQLDSFDPYEVTQFQAAAAWMKLTSIQDLILFSH